MSGDRVSGAGGDRVVFRGRLLDVRVEKVRRDDGGVLEREVVRHPGAAAVVPLFRGPEGPRVALVRQYRHPAGTSLLEIPAGTLEPGEEPSACAARELEEETGLRAGRLVTLPVLRSSPGFTDERIHLFVGLDLEEAEARGGEEEGLERVDLPLAAALGMVGGGRIEDAKTACALLLTARFLGIPRVGGRGSSPSGR